MLFIVRIIEFLALIAVVASLWFLYDANKISQDGLEDSRKASLDALARVDSSLVLLTQQVKIQEEQSRTERRTYSLKETEFLEKEKPVFEVKSLSMIQSDSGLNLTFAVNNEGRSRATEVIIYLRIKTLDNFALQFDTTWFFREFLPQKPIIFPIKFSNWKGSHIVWYVDVRFKWPAMNYESSNRRSFNADYQSNDNKFNVSVFDDTDHRKYWGEP